MKRRLLETGNNFDGSLYLFPFGELDLNEVT